MGGGEDRTEIPSMQYLKGKAKVGGIIGAGMEELWEPQGKLRSRLKPIKQTRPWMKQGLGVGLE